MSIQDLKKERAELQAKLEFFNVQSPGREKHEQRMREIDRILSWASSRVIETPNSAGISLQGKQG